MAFDKKTTNEKKHSTWDLSNSERFEDNDDRPKYKTVML